MNKYFFFALLGIFILAGCQAQVQQQVPVVTEPVAEEASPVEELPGVEVQLPAPPSDEFTMHEGDSAMVNNAEVKVALITNDPYLATVEVNGRGVRLYETGQHEIEGGVDITLLQWQYKDRNNPENTLTLKLLPLSLKPDEFLFVKNEVKTFNGRNVKVLEISTDGSMIVGVTPSELGEERIGPGKSIVIEGIEIKPILTFTRDPTRSPYAIVTLKTV